MVHSWSAFSTLSLNWVAWCGGGQKGVYATTTRATATKTSLNNLRCPKLYCALWVPSRLIRQMLAIFLELNSKGLHQSSGKEKESCCLLFPSSTKREIRQFHVVVVQRRQRNVQKSVMHVQSCCFACLNLLLLCRSRCRRGNCRCVNSLKLRHLRP